MVTLDYTLLGGNGDSITLDGSLGIYLTAGLTGTGVPSTDVTITNSAGDGGVWRSTRRGVRQLDMPLMVIGTDRGDVEAKLRRIASAMSDRYGTPKLLASYSDGSAYDIEVHYTGGAETQFGSEAGATFCKWVVTMSAPDPYWVSRSAVNFSLATASGTRGLISASTGVKTLSRLIVQSSQILGDFAIENTGDVDTYPVWTLEGLSSSFSISYKGTGFSYTESMTSGSKTIINTKTATVVDASGTNKYAYLGTAPKLFTIPPGLATITIAVTGSDATTKLSGYFNPRREVLH